VRDVGCKLPHPDMHGFPWVAKERDLRKDVSGPAQKTAKKAVAADYFGPVAITKDGYERQIYL
jgi:hypothetical protein